MYRSVVFDLSDKQNCPKIEKDDLQIFKSHMEDRLSELKSAKRRSIWFKIPQTHLYLLETMVHELKFDIHHVSDHDKKSNPYVMCCKWLETSERYLLNLSLKETNH